MATQRVLSLITCTVCNAICPLSLVPQVIPQVIPQEYPIHLKPIGGNPPLWVWRIGVTTGMAWSG